MATREAKLKIGVEGEKEYKQAIADINKGNQVLNSEMKLLQERYQGNENSMEALTAKSDLLERQLQSQKDKVATLRDALKNAGEQYGEADKRTQSWQIQLNNAERDQIKLEKALQETNAEIKGQGDATEAAGEKMATLGDQVSGIAEKFGVHLPGSVKSALDNVNGFSTATVAAMGAAVAGVAAVKVAIDGVTAGIKAAQKLHEITLEQAHWADDLLTQSAKTGIDTTTLQGLNYASNFLDFDGLDKSLVKLTASMGQAAEGAEKQSAAFATLGISVKDTDGNMRSNYDVMLEAIDALGQVENATERDLLANELFGKSYSDLKPLIDAGSGALNDMIEAAKESGLVLSEDQVKTLGEVDDAYQQYQAQITATKNKLSLEFAPISTQVMENFGSFITKAGDAFVESGILTSLQGFIEPLNTILTAFGDLLDLVLPALTPLVEGLASAFQTLAGWVESAVNWLKQLDIEKSVQATMTDQAVNDFDWGTGGVYDWNAAGDVNWRGGLTWVGETGPEIVDLPRGSRIYSAQESGLIAANSGTDTSRLEALLERSVALQEQIAQEFSALRVKRRMA